MMLGVEKLQICSRWAQKWTGRPCGRLGRGLRYTVVLRSNQGIVTNLIGVEYHSGAAFSLSYNVRRSRR
jgi:hypothetical protein